ncbi:unnamed protein product, partial [Ascophyllum nodosum]
MPSDPMTAPAGPAQETSKTPERAGGHSEDGSDLREALLHHTPPRDVRPHPQATCSLSGLFYSWSTKSAPAHTKAILATARLGSLKLRSLTYTFLTSVVRAFTLLGSSGDGAIT